MRASHRSELVALPPTGAPRYLMPRDRRNAAAAARFFTAGQGSTRSRALRTFAAAGAVKVLPRHSSDQIAAWREALRAGPVPFTDLAVYWGPPRANAKPVLALVESGVVTAVAKVGTNPLTDRLVRAESVALTGLPPRGDVFEAPRVLYDTEAEGHPVLVISAFDLSTRVGGGGRHPDLVALARAIAEPGEPIPMRESGWWNREIGSGQIPEVLVEVLHRCKERTIVPSASHGDLTRWNCARGFRHWLVWDWERYTQVGIWGADLLHWHLFEGERRGGFGPAVDGVIQDRHRILADTGLDPDERDLTTLLYLAALAGRYSADGQPWAEIVRDAAISYSRARFS